MCLGIPGQVVRMLDGYEGQVALVDVAGEHRKVNGGMLPEETFAPGDWVIIHMGFVVEKTDRAGADEAMAGLQLLRRGEFGKGRGAWQNAPTRRVRRGNRLLRNRRCRYQIGCPQRETRNGGNGKEL